MGTTVVGVWMCGLRGSGLRAADIHYYWTMGLWNIIGLGDYGLRAASVEEQAD